MTVLAADARLEPTPDDRVLDALVWCRQRNALIRFESNQTVTVKVSFTQRRRKTLVLAVEALKNASKQRGWL